MSEPVPNWKFWSPLPFWQVLLVFGGLNLVGLLAVVTLRQGLSLGVPPWVGTGIAGALSVVVVSALARRRRERDVQGR